MAVNFQEDGVIDLDNIKTDFNVKSDYLHVIKDNGSNTKVKIDENTPKQLLPCYVPIVRLTEADLERYGAKRSRKSNRKKCYTYKNKKIKMNECRKCGESYYDKKKYEIHMQIKHSKLLNGSLSLSTTKYIETLNNYPQLQDNLMDVDQINSESAVDVKIEFTPGNCDELQGTSLRQLWTDKCTDNVESPIIVKVESNSRYYDKQQQGTVILGQLSSEFYCDDVKSLADIKVERPQSSVCLQDLDEQNQGTSLGLLRNGDCDDNMGNLVKVKEEFDPGDYDGQNQETSLGLLSSDDRSDTVESLIDVKEEFDPGDYDEQNKETSLGLLSDDRSDNVESLIDVKKEFDPEDYDGQNQGTTLGQQSNGLIELKNKTQAASFQTTVKKPSDGFKRKVLNDKEMFEVREKRKIQPSFLRSEMKCLKCLEKFLKQDNLERHNMKHHFSSGDFMCPICEQRFVKDFYRDKHFRAHFLVYECLYCAMIFNYKYAAYNHVSSVHMQPEIRRNNPICPAPVKSQENLISSGDSTTTFICDICKKEFIHKRNIAHHMKYNHDARTRKDCKICGKWFPSLAHLVHHVNRHLSIYTYLKSMKSDGEDGSYIIKKLRGTLEVATEVKP